MKYNIRITNYIYLNELLKKNQEANKNSLDKLYEISFCDKNFLISLNLLNILKSVALTIELNGKIFINQADINYKCFSINIGDALESHGYFHSYGDTPEHLFHQNDLRQSQESLLTHCQTEMNSVY
ncbi:MAG: hypothetical protein EP298_05740 [Gammaproteobacteria bacterium]|nr:MAG: hypothetical protein EP298_05740 [Gammaproteobacteria bacterium]UTW41442.1 hypothetical protein KFE69_07930 [bacterium SCSIO 12844]